MTLLAGGGTVYVYPDIHDDGVAERVATQRTVIDVAYPAEDTTVAVIDESRLPEMRQALAHEGIKVIDTRRDDIELSVQIPPEGIRNGQWRLAAMLDDEESE